MAMSSLNMKSEQIRKDQSFKSNAKSIRKSDINSDSTMKTVLQKSTQKSSNINKPNVNIKRNIISSNKNKTTNDSIIKTKSAIDMESKASLQKKIKYLEEELEKYDFERSRITQELDRVCEEKDNQISDLKTIIKEKELEIDHQMCSVRKNKIEFEEEVNKFKLDFEYMRTECQTKESDLMVKNESLEKQLFDLNDYIRNRDQTLAKIRELEEYIKQQNIFHKKVKEKLNNELENEKLKVEELVTQRVNEIRKSLETLCLNKLSINARIALEKFEELSNSYETCEQECRQLRKSNQTMKVKIQKQKLYLEVSESLLHEMLKQLNRKLYYRKNVCIQTDETLEKKN